MEKTAVVILNFNGKKFLEKFVPVLVKNTPSATLIIADNGSKDDSTEWVKNNHPSITILSLKKNYGFAEGYNRALNMIKGQFKYYVLLNSDVEVTPEWLTPLHAVMEKNHDLAACQPKILSFHKKNVFEYAGASGGYIDKYGYPFCRGRIFETLETDTGQYDNATEIFWASGACLFVNAKIFHNLDGFDSNFFAHMEEIDFCWRARNKGYKIMVEPKATVYHVGGGTLSNQSPQKTYLNFRNNFYLLFKNLSPNNLVPIIGSRLVLDGIAGIKFLFNGNYYDTLAIIKAHFSFYSKIRVLMKKRKKLKPQKCRGIYKGNIVWEYYIKGNKKFSSLDEKKFT